MLTREQILRLIPHQGTMCLLDRVLTWSAAEIVCAASSHTAPGNPLRRDGRLGAICGIEYGLQAAALHGALVRGGAAGGAAAAADLCMPPPAYLAALRGLELFVEYLDDPALGVLRITAAADLVSAGGSIYRFTVAAEAARPLLRGRATIAFSGRAA